MVTRSRSPSDSVPTIVRASRVRLAPSSSTDEGAMRRNNISWKMPLPPPLSAVRTTRTPFESAPRYSYWKNPRSPASGCFQRRIRPSMSGASPKRLLFEQPSRSTAATTGRESARSVVSARMQPGCTAALCHSRPGGGAAACTNRRSAWMSTVAPMILASWPAEAHHLVSTALEFVGHRLDRHVVAGSAQEIRTSCDERRRHAPEREQRKDPHFRRDPAKFQNRGVMKGLSELTAVQEQQVRTERQVEPAIAERQ